MKRKKNHCTKLHVEWTSLPIASSNLLLCKLKSLCCSGTIVRHKFGRLMITVCKEEKSGEAVIDRLLG